MHCPNCEYTPLIILEFQEVELDFCPECLGIWFDSEELEWILQGDFDEQVMFKEKEHAEKVKKCPRCRKKMKKVVSKDMETVVYDVCPKGDGIWFDRGELNRLLEHYKEHPGAETFLTWLWEVFNYNPDTNNNY
ncbi:MAG: zf-TFIIB domain-containing protein [Candidatus Hydrogenedentes bacterium]|nr:zf-TFIIB domain-containing protein [Candidatus Hydrogenedentota bacterium]